MKQSFSGEFASKLTIATEQTESQNIEDYGMVYSQEPLIQLGKASKTLQSKFWCHSDRGNHEKKAQYSQYLLHSDHHTIQLSHYYPIEGIRGLGLDRAHLLWLSVGIIPLTSLFKYFS
jgi:hypothetical protein